MTDEAERAGLGKVIYSVDEREETPREKKDEAEERAEVEEADKESFPASDPPSFGGAKEPPCD
jgi:hypothetical protein